MRIELELAYSHGLAIMPLLVTGASMPAADELPPSLRWLLSRNAFRIRANPDFHHDMDRVVAAVEVRRAAIEEERRRTEEAQQLSRSTGATGVGLGVASLGPFTGLLTGLTPSILKMVFAALALAVGRATLVFVLVGLVAAVGTEWIAAYLTGIFPPTWSADATTAAIAGSYGAASAVTVAIIQIASAIVTSVELAVIEAERYGEVFGASSGTSPASEAPMSGSQEQQTDSDGTLSGASENVSASQAANVIDLLGFVAKYVLGILTRTFGRLFLVFALFSLLAAAATEGIAAVTTGIFPPQGAAHLAAAAIAIGVGYLVASLMALHTTLFGISRGIELVAVEAQRYAAEQDTHAVLQGSAEAPTSTPHATNVPDSTSTSLG